MLAIATGTANPLTAGFAAIAETIATDAADDVSEEVADGEE